MENPPRRFGRKDKKQDKDIKNKIKKKEYYCQLREISTFKTTERGQTLGTQFAFLFSASLDKKWERPCVQPLHDNARAGAYIRMNDFSSDSTERQLCSIIPESCPWLGVCCYK